MTSDDEFDEFYRATRQRLVLQTFALTGDLAAARGAVRDSYVATWHHWRKVSAGDRPEDWVRPRAWKVAQRRHNARLRLRDRDLSPEHAAILEAIAGLPIGQRKALLLTHLSSVSMTQMAREIGVTVEVAGDYLQAATAGFAIALDVDSTSVRAHLESLSAATEGVPLPRAPIVRRAGKKRRRAHTIVATAAAAALTVSAGAVVHQPADVEAAAGAHLLAPLPSAQAQAQAQAQPVGAAAESGPSVSGDQLLDRHQIERLGPGQDWEVLSTSDNTAGDGINTACQQTRFADPDGTSALVRHFRASGTPERTAVQTVEVSTSEAEAKKAFDTTLGWYAGCEVDRVQLLRGYDVDRVGDEAQVLLLRSWERPQTTYSVAVARSGQVTTSTVGRTVGAGSPGLKQIAQSLSDSVSMLCTTSGSDVCAQPPRVHPAPPPPAGEEAGMLAVADLPPVGGIGEPWVGTEASPARSNPAATTCDRADFGAAGAQRTRTRTFLIPDAHLPSRFGLSETYGVFGSHRSAARFLRTVRDRMAACEDKDLATTTTLIDSARSAKKKTGHSIWEMRTEISETETVTFRMAVVRLGRTVAQINFTPTADDDLPNHAFRDLVARAQERLRELTDGSGVTGSQR